MPAAEPVEDYFHGDSAFCFFFYDGEQFFTDAVIVERINAQENFFFGAPNFFLEKWIKLFSAVEGLNRKHGLIITPTGLVGDAIIKQRSEAYNKTIMLSKNKTGLALGMFLAVAHLVWLILVAVGLAKPLIDLVLSLHHLSLSYSVTALSIVPAIGLLVYAFVVGYVLGWVFAAVWNKLSK